MSIRPSKSFLAENGDIALPSQTELDAKMNAVLLDTTGISSICAHLQGYRSRLLRQLQIVDQKAMLGNEEALRRRAVLEEDMRLVEGYIRELNQGAAQAIHALQRLKGLKLFNLFGSLEISKLKEVQ